MSAHRVVVFSCDAMVWEDMEYLLNKPRCRALYEKGPAVRRIRTIYPSVTYPCHTSMSTGCYPDLGPQPVFFGVGPDIREGVYLDRREIVDEAPTYAKILGVSMPWADGHPIKEILR